MRTLPLLALLAAGLSALPAQEIAFDSTPNFLKLPEHIHLGEAAGVATDSKGNLFVYERSGTNTTTGGSRLFTHGGSRLFEFDRTGKFVREIGQGVYGFLFAQSVRIDSKDNIWVVDRGSNMVIKFNPEGRVIMTLSRKPESVGEGGRGGGRGGTGAGVPGDNFNKPTDVAFDSAGNIYVADGYGNARIAKMDAHGKYLKSWGTRGTDPGQFNLPLSIATDAKDNVYVADRGNNRIQVFDGEGTFKAQIANVGTPQAICVSGGSTQYLYSSNSNDPESMDHGEIYKIQLNGQVVGKFGKAGKLAKEFGMVNAIDCRTENDLIVGEVWNWRAQKVK